MRDQTVREAAPSEGARRGLRGIPARHPVASALVVTALLGLAIFGFLWLRPDKLFVDKTVDEALPSAPPAQTSPTAGATGDPATSEPRTLSVGPFRDLEHDTSGRARVLELADGRRVLRLEDFRTSNGPDVIVILSDTPATEDDWGAYDDGDFVKVGVLKGNRGNQNYDVPAGVDLSAYRSVVIWCRRFNVAFGAAPLDLRA